MAWVKELLPRVPLQFATMHGHLNRRPFKIVKYQIVKISSRNDKDKIRVQTAQLNHFGLPAPVPSSSFRPGLSLRLLGVLADHAAAAPPRIVV